MATMIGNLDPQSILSAFQSGGWGSAQNMLNQYSLPEVSAFTKYLNPNVPAQSFTSTNDAYGILPLLLDRWAGMSTPSGGTGGTPYSQYLSSEIGGQAQPGDWASILSSLPAATVTPPPAATAPPAPAPTPAPVQPAPVATTPTPAVTQPAPTAAPPAAVAPPITQLPGYTDTGQYSNQSSQALGQYPHNPLSTPGASPFSGEGVGGLNLNISDLLNLIGNTAQQSSWGSALDANQLGGALQQYFMGQNPGASNTNASNAMAAYMNPASQMLSQYSGQLPTILNQMLGSASNLANQSTGLTQNSTSASNAANWLLGGQGQQYGVSNALNQIMNLGLPGQQSMIDLMGNQQGVGTGAQGTAVNQLSQMVQNGGLSPQYVQAMRQNVLQPSLESLQGNLNKYSMGAAQPSSGLYQELARRQESEFNNQLTNTGMNNMTNALSQLGGLGQAGIGNAMTGFNNVASQVYPYLSLAGGLSSDLQNQALQNYSTQAGGLQTLQNVALQPYTTASNMLQTGAGQNLEQNDQLTKQLLQFLTGQQNYGLGNQDTLQSMATLMGNMGIGQATMDNQNSQQKWKTIGDVIANIAGAAAGIFGGGGD